MLEYVLIAGLGLLMGIVTSISGGAGVFAVPTMLAMGLPPVNVLALNRLSDLGVVTGAFKNYQKSKSVDWKIAFLAALPLTIGSFIGANLVVGIPEEKLNWVIIFGVFVGIFFLIKKPKPSPLKNIHFLWILRVVLMLLVGMWSGALGMAGATFAVLVLVYFFNQNFLQARATDVVAAIPETLVAVVVLFLSSTVSNYLAVTMFVASFIGAWIGSHLAVKHGGKFIRKAMIAIALIMIIKVIYDLLAL